jgi:hypothetical protein
LITVMVIVTKVEDLSHSSLWLSDWCTIIRWLDCHGLLIIEL